VYFNIKGEKSVIQTYECNLTQNNNSIPPYGSWVMLKLINLRLKASTFVVDKAASQCPSIKILIVDLVSSSSIDRKYRNCYVKHYDRSLNSYISILYA